VTRRASYGTWESPFTAEFVTRSGPLVEGLDSDGDDLYWLEARPDEGREMIVRRAPDGSVSDVLPDSFEIGSSVHSSGGRCWLAFAGAVYACSGEDGRVYRIADGTATPLTPEGPFSYSDPDVDAVNRRLIWVREDSSDPHAEARDAIVAFALDGGDVEVLAEGADFYSSPRVSPDGSTLAFVRWNHPHPNFGATELCVDGRVVAGGDDDVAILPAWSPDGVLHFVSEATGWWNLYRLEGEEAVPLCPMQAEFCVDSRVLTDPSFVFLPDGRIVTVVTENALSRLCVLDDGVLSDFDPNLTWVNRPKVLSSGKVAYIGMSWDLPQSLLLTDVATGVRTTLRSQLDAEIDRRYVGPPEVVSFPADDGITAHGWLFRPKNPDFEAPDGELPPLIVHTHGGPVGVEMAAFGTGMMSIINPYIWSSRGYNVLMVNYRGSTGYGRAYRHGLYRTYGPGNAADAVGAAKHMAAIGEAEPDRILKRGPSAGGYTVLYTLAMDDAFRAGADYFGISDFELLVEALRVFRDTVDLGDWLIAPDEPGRETILRERSPIHFADRISAPVLILQGAEDRGVPKNQSDVIVAALAERGVPYAYICFEGEGHGFIRAENNRRALEAEISFYAQILGLELTEDVPPLKIENLQPAQA
jgi:dipeptidyl aminopeptidase/acylaminoacyl peptidase